MQYVLHRIAGMTGQQSQMGIKIPMSTILVTKIVLTPRKPCWKSAFPFVVYTARLLHSEPTTQAAKCKLLTKSSADMFSLFMEI